MQITVYKNFTCKNCLFKVDGEQSNDFIDFCNYAGISLPELQIDEDFQPEICDLKQITLHQSLA